MKIPTMLAKGLLLVVFVGGLCLVGLAITVFWSMSDYDVFDRFLVIGNESDPAGGKHAVTYQYDHANSSRQVLATWLLPSARPIGSTEPVRGRIAPVLVATTASDVISKAWRNGRLIISVPGTVTLIPNNVPARFFEDQQDHLVCFDPNVVVIDAR